MRNAAYRAGALAAPALIAALACEEPLNSALPLSLCIRPEVRAVPTGSSHPAATEVVSRPIDGSPFAVATSVSGTAYITRLHAFQNISAVRADLPATTLSAPFAVGPAPAQVRISPDGQTAFVGNTGGTGTVTFVSVATNQILGTATLPYGDIVTIGLTPDGARLFALTRDFGVFEIDRVTRTVIDSIPKALAGDLLTGVAFHPFSPCMYIAARDSGELRVVDLTRLEVVRAFRAPGARTEKIAVSRDGATLFATDAARSGLLTLDFLGEVSTFTPLGTAGVFDVAVSPDDAQLYVTSAEAGRVYVLDRWSREILDTISTGGAPKHVAFSATGDIAVIANEAGWVDFVQSAAPAQCTAAPPPGGLGRPSLSETRLAGLSGTPFAVAVSPTGATYVTRVEASTMVRADLPLMALSAPFNVGPLPSQVRFSPNGQTAYVSNQNSGVIKFINVATNQVTDSVTLSTGGLLNFDVSPDGARLYGVMEFSDVYAIDVATRSVVDTLDAGVLGHHLAGMAFHPTDPTLYVASRDGGRVGTIDLATLTIVHIDSVPGGLVQNLAVSRDGAFLYATDYFRSMLLTRDLSSPTSVFTETTVGAGSYQNLFDVAVTPDNAQVYVGAHQDHKVYVYDRVSLALVDSIATGGRPRYIGFSANGTCAVIPNEQGWVNFVY